MSFGIKVCACLGAWLSIQSFVYADTAPSKRSVTLNQVVQQAIKDDPWLTSSKQQQASTHALSDGATALPNPKVNFALLNFPSDTFNYNQEPITQLLFGISQTLPRGDTLALRSKHYTQQSLLNPIQREQRRAEVRLIVTQLWLEAANAYHSIKLIEGNKRLFRQLKDAVSSSYSNAFSSTRQQDILKAELELDQINERLLQLRLQYHAKIQQLTEWIDPLDEQTLSFDKKPALLLQTLAKPSQHTRTQTLIQHPAIRLFDQRIAVANTTVELAQEQYKPEWGVNASYGIRGEDARGDDRADFVTIGVTVDVPLFSTKRQDAQVKSDTYALESIKTDRLLAIKRLMTQSQTLETEIEYLDKRLALYQNRLLPGFDRSADASVNSYQTDTADLLEPIRARISELNAKLSLLSLQLERSKKAAQLNYLFTASSESEQEISQ